MLTTSILVLCIKSYDNTVQTHIIFAITSQATARTSCSSESHISEIACFLNHFLTTNKQYTTHALYSSPPALFAVLTTAGVTTLLCAFVIFHLSSSHGITVSIWYLRRRATFVTSLAGIGEGMTSRRVGRTGMNTISEISVLKDSASERKNTNAHASHREGGDERHDCPC